MIDLKESIFAKTLMYEKINEYMYFMEKDFSKKERRKVKDRYTFLINLLEETGLLDEYTKWPGDINE